MEASHTYRRKSKRKAPPPAVLAKVDHERLSLLQILPAPENDRLYGPVPPTDPEVVALASSIRKLGILEPLVITADNYVVSGHRRLVGATLAGLEDVPVRRLPIRRDDDIDGFVRLLREHNRQRDKTNDQRMREELVDISPVEAHRKLREFRQKKSVVTVGKIDLGTWKSRKAISSAKQPLLGACCEIVYGESQYWPLSARRIHYALQNNPPLIHAKKPRSTYSNDMKSYRALIDILVRGRLEGEIPFEAIDDETRTTETWDVHRTVRSFFRREMMSVLRGFYRDLMQSDPNQIELVVEKNTAKPIVETVAAEFTIPCTTGRGFCSLPPRHAMAERFKMSGKEKLIILIVSDFDPEGESIAESFARSMRDDFSIYSVHAIKVALTADQVREHNLPPMLKAKATSSRFKKFVGRHGDDVYELEALRPEVLQSIVREAILSVIDQDAYAREVEQEAEDAAELERRRCRLLRDVQDDELEEDDRE